MANFSLDMRRFVNKTKDKSHYITRKVLLDIATRIVERSPVGNPELWAVNRNRRGRKLRMPKGYVGGRFRGNWQYGNNTITFSYHELDEIDPQGTPTINRISARIGETPGGKVHWIFNNLPYAEPLERGWSKQAPAGMVGLTLVEFEGLVGAAANEVVDQ